MLTIKYKKINSATYISHIDTLRAITRAIRRAELTTEYSKGFNPHQQIFLSPPLPLFVSSVAEYFTVDTREEKNTFYQKYCTAALQDLTPIKIFYTQKYPNLAGKITAADYCFEIDYHIDNINKTTCNLDKQVSSTDKSTGDLEKHIDRIDTPPCLAQICNDLLSKTQILYEHRKGEKDMRPHILNAIPDSTSANITFTLDAISLRADAVANHLTKNHNIKIKAITKIAQYVKHNNFLIDVDDYLRSSL